MAVLCSAALTACGGGSGAGSGSKVRGRLVVLTNDRRLVVVDAADGHEVRTLATGISPPLTAPQLAVSPTGDAVYADRSTPAQPGQCPNGAATIPEVVRVPAAGNGAPQRVAFGMLPAVSPDGKHLASVTSASGTRCLATADAVVVQPIAADGSVGAPAATFEVGDAETSALGLSWAPDSRHLAVSLLRGDAFEPRLLDTQAVPSSTRIEGAPPLLASNTGAKQAYLGTTGDVVAPQFRESRTVVRTDPKTARSEKLFEAPCRLIGDVLVASDRAGTRTAVPCTDGLVIWSTRGGAPREIIGAFRTAGWLPSGAG
jgi:hypothetical protein